MKKWYFCVFRFNEKKELIEIKLNIRPNSIVFFKFLMKMWTFNLI